MNYCGIELGKLNNSKQSFFLLILIKLNLFKYIYDETNPFKFIQIHLSPIKIIL